MDPQEPVVTEVVVDIPGWQSVKPRIPDTLQRRRLEEQRSVREIVFGAQDGILTTLGIITGVGVAEGARSAVFISGFLAMLAGALSMAVGEYLGGKSEREVVQATIEMEKAEMAADPQGEFAEQVAYYKMKGFSAEEAQMIVRRLTQHPDIYLYEMMRDEFGIDPRVAEDTDLRAPIAMGGSFAVGSLIPIVAYIVPLTMIGSTILALVLAVASTFRRRILRRAQHRSQSGFERTRNRRLRRRRVRALVSRRPLHSAAVRPRAGFSGRLIRAAFRRTIRADTRRETLAIPRRAARPSAAPFW